MDTRHRARQQDSMESSQMWNEVFQDDNQAILTNTKRIGGKKGEVGQRGLSGKEWAVPTWVSKRYAGDGAQIDALSIRCPMQLGFEKSRKEVRVTE